MVTGDDHSTRTRLLTLGNLINLIQPFPLIRCPQLLSEIIIAHRSSVHHRASREDVLSAARYDTGPKHTIVSKTHSSPTRSVLGRSSSDVRDWIVFDDFLVAADRE